MSKEQTFENTKFITGLRAYSALGVFLVHTVAGTGFLNDYPIMKQLFEFGRFGVISFFVLSAFTICMSVDQSGSFSFKSYLFRRFMRIAPMYYTAILFFFFATDGIGYYNELFGVKTDLYNLLMHITFLNLFDARHANNIIGVEATVPIEFAYYLVIPFAFFGLLKKTSWLYPVLIITFLLSFYSFKLFNGFYNPIAPTISHHWSVEKYLFIFCIGICTYVVWRKPNNTFNSNSFILLFHLILLAYIIRQDFKHTEIILSIWVSGLIFICSGKSWLSVFLFENRLIEYLGKISYSIYLVHFPILMLLRNHTQSIPIIFSVGLLVTLLISMLCYKFIEKPFIKLSKKTLVK